jgi:hypothetical protein
MDVELGFLVALLGTAVVLVGDGLGVRDADGSPAAGLTS